MTTGNLAIKERNNLNDLEKGWEDFPFGTLVEVQTENGVWKKGRVVETPKKKARAIIVKCYEKVSRADFYDGYGFSIMVFQRTRGEILAKIRKPHKRSFDSRPNPDDRED